MRPKLDARSFFIPVNNRCILPSIVNTGDRCAKTREFLDELLITAFDMIDL